LVTGNNDGVSRLVGDGDGTSRKPINYLASLGAAIAVADVNGDDVPDVIAGSPEQVTVLLNGAGSGPNVANAPLTATRSWCQLPQTNEIAAEPGVGRAAHLFS